MSEQERDNGQEVRNAELERASDAELMEYYDTARRVLFAATSVPGEDAARRERANAARAEILRRMSTGNPQGERARECEAPEHLSTTCRCAQDCPCREDGEAERSDSRATGETCSYRDVVAGASCIRPDMPHEEHWLPVNVPKRVIDTASRIRDFAAGGGMTALPLADGVTDATAHLQAGLDAEAEQRDGRIQAKCEQGYTLGRSYKCACGPCVAFRSGERSDGRVSEESGDNLRKGGNAETWSEKDRYGRCGCGDPSCGQDAVQQDEATRQDSRNGGVTQDEVKDKS